MINEEFRKRFNNYKCISKNDSKSGSELSHYTPTSEAAINISRGCFWATDLQDFDDELEGKLIFKRIHDILLSKDIVGITPEHVDHINECIGDDEKIKTFMNKYVTNVVSLCNNTDSSYMWDNYAKDPKNPKNSGYNIIFDKLKLISSLHFCTKNGKQKDESYFFKHALIEYDEDEQIKVVKKEIDDLIAAQKNEINTGEFIDYLLRHLMFVGNYYKSKGGIESGEYKKYIEEEEYRILINTYAENSFPDKDFIKYLPEHNERERKEDKKKIKYVKIYFDPKAVLKIVCRTDKAKSRIEKELPNILLEVKNR